MIKRREGGGRESERKFHARACRCISATPCIAARKSHRLDFGFDTRTPEGMARSEERSKDGILEVHECRDESRRERESEGGFED